MAIGLMTSGDSIINITSDFAARDHCPYLVSNQQSMLVSLKQAVITGTMTTKVRNLDVVFVPTPDQTLTIASQKVFIFQQLFVTILEGRDKLIKALMFSSGVSAQVV